MENARFGRWIVLAPAARPKHWRCRCDCGNERDVWQWNLTRGLTLSCGCRAREATARRSTKHGGATRKGMRPEYGIWRAMVARCHNPNTIAYANYGGRGIAVCSRWRTYAGFIADMGLRPSPKHSLDRINNDGNYEPGNVRWATDTEQANNSRHCRYVTAWGRTATLRAWAGETGISEDALAGRLDRGWPPERAFSTPSVRGRNQHSTQ